MEIMKLAIVFATLVALVHGNPVTPVPGEDWDERLEELSSMAISQHIVEYKAQLVKLTGEVAVLERATELQQKTNKVEMDRVTAEIDQTTAKLNTSADFLVNEMKGHNLSIQRMFSAAAVEFRMLAQQFEALQNRLNPIKV